MIRLKLYRLYACLFVVHAVCRSVCRPGCMPSVCQVVFTTNGVAWGFNLTDGNTVRPFICQTAKAFASQALTLQRDYTYGVFDRKDYKRGPNFIKQPKSALYMRGSSVYRVVFECLAEGIPLPTYTWYQITVCTRVWGFW